MTDGPTGALNKTDARFVDTRSAPRNARQVLLRLTSSGRRLVVRPVRIPGQFGQRFQFNSDTDSDSFRTVIPIQIGQALSGAARTGTLALA